MQKILTNKIFISIVVTVIVLLLSSLINYKLSPLAVVVSSDIIYLFNYKEGKTRKNSNLYMFLYNIVFIGTIIFIAYYPA